MQGDEIRFADSIECGHYSIEQTGQKWVAVRMEGDKLEGAYPVMICLTPDDARQLAADLVEYAVELSN